VRRNTRTPQHPRRLTPRDTHRWYEQELPAALRSRAPHPHITQPELVKLVGRLLATRGCAAARLSRRWRCWLPKCC
jgi:hypothetical protein